MCVHTWKDPETYQIWTVNQVNHNDWPKENSEEMPYESNPNCHKGKTQQLRNSPCESAHVSIHMYCTLFLVMNTLPASLLSVFVETLFWKVEGQNLNLCFPHCEPAQSLAGNPSPAASHCKWRPLRSYLSDRELPSLSVLCLTQLGLL